MITKEIIESVTPAIYSNALRIVGDNPLYDRESFIIDSIAEFWWAIIDRIEMQEAPKEALSAESFVYLLRQYLPELVVVSKENHRIEIKTDNWVYTISDGLNGFRGVGIYPQYHYVPAERAEWLIRHGLTPKTKNPDRFLAKLLIAFDRLIPEMKETIHEIEFKAMYDYKEHEIRKTILRNLLATLPIKASFFICKDKTKCEIEIDGWTLTFFVSNADIPSCTETLYKEMQEIIRNPRAALKFGNKYSVE